MKGINNQPCIGPCLPKDTTILHPIYLFPITKDKPFCPTFQWIDDENTRYLDICQKETDSSKINNKDIELLYAIPNFGFDCAYFLKNYYDLHSFEGTLDWLYSQNNNLSTKLRVMNCAWELFGTNSDINDQLIDFYMEVVNKVWIYDVYNAIYDLITVENHNIYFKKNKSDKKAHKVEKINFILDKFGNKSILYNVLKNFIETSKSKWKNIKNYNNELKKYYIDYILDKIKTTLDKK